ncbi:MAG: hypothetical protein JXR34_08495 [Bacteroidales bacterium]|nr:hypothetical protein [Bacteroidales bacterium]
MNKTSTLKSYFGSLKTNNSFDSLTENKSQDSSPKPSERVIQFLIQYSKTLESKKGLSYQLN